MRIRLLAMTVALPLAALLPQGHVPASACTRPDRWSVAASFDLAANGLLPASLLQPPASNVRTIPPSVLKAVGWVESGWRQFSPQGHPLVSYDFGYGIMQITSGMAGAFGKVNGDLDPEVQSRIASDFAYNIAYGTRMLAAKWKAVPAVGNGDPAVIENWYYALWAYNGWGWANNPNNPRFTRQGTPAMHPSSYPYQERVFYLVAHPPRDADGNPLWRPVPVSLPKRNTVGLHPGRLRLSRTHRQDPAALSAVYRPAGLKLLSPAAAQRVRVRLTNTGTAPWLSTGPAAVDLTYHLLTTAADPFQPLTPFSNGVLAYGQGGVPLPHDVAPGGQVSLRVQVRSPAQPGTYHLAWDLQQGTSEWFSQLGALPHVQTLRVVGASTPPEPPGGPAASRPTPTPASRESLQYVADTSVPDGTTLAPRQAFLKGWLVFNNGTTGWQHDWRLRLVSGPAFGARQIPVPPTHPCRSANIVAHLRAPARPGTYKSTWQLEDGQGHRSGQQLTVVLNVLPGGTHPTPIPSVPPSPTPRPVRTPLTPTPVG